MLILFLMIINYYFLLVASFELTDEELLSLKKDIKPEKLKKFIQFGITFVVELLLDDETSSACYRDYPYMAECAEDELESIAPLIGRSCFKKCEEYEIEEGNICYSCKDGSKLLIEKQFMVIKILPYLIANFKNYLMLEFLKKLRILIVWLIQSKLVNYVIKIAVY